MDFELTRARSGVVLYIFNPALGRQRLADLCKSQDSLVYIVRHFYSI